MTKTGINIGELKSFSAPDAERLRILTKNLGESYQELTDQEIKRILKSDTTHLIIARDQKTKNIIGMGTLSIYRIPYLRKAYLDDFIIDEAYQGQGIGSRLMKYILDNTRKSGASYLEFTSNPKRVGANKFYQKQGFEKRKTNVYRINFEHE